MTSRKSARERILEVACDMFYHKGIRSVGVDTIVEKSGVGKATLYRHFPTKDDLIAAYLVESDKHDWKQFDDIIAKYEGSPKEQLLAFIDTITDTMVEPDFRGCAFLNALAEFPEESHFVKRMTVEYNHSLRSRLNRLTQQAGAKDESLTDQLMLVITGALSLAHALGSAGPASQLKALAAHLIDVHVA
ncbi:TetR/AcrR family transcriptional regulator [Paenibacillus radicis (ex Gao et al. 2016)]|uniref:TetR family transcriptional regulator n=1 Tax=Paenibacillus radicis (ex Gao et al. 2016) TaxID=1737354 RepID=A0A917GV16_9BACL|nr:TetR/AcrR family transcriptional regulator [Paenibacillus radicis (ex Gao et al. 2016)]GGG58046.1 TetR family transcriptional regulator [Paenibacillus radicis (ex Gao et al. 2016)]